MIRRVIAFVDHEIGYRLLEKCILMQTTYGFELAAVVTTQDNGKMWWPAVLDLCQKNKLLLHRYYEPLSEIHDYENIDWYFLISWKHILPVELINVPNLGVINLHYSLLPEYRGLYPVNWAIIDGKKNTGITYHLVDKNIDDGYIICQKATSIYLIDTARSLQLRLDDLAYDLFDDMVYWAMHIRVIPVNFARRNGAKTNYRSRSDFIASNQLDPNREYSVKDLINLLRGKTHLPESRNLYIIDPDTGKRVYINLHLISDE